MHGDYNPPGVRCDRLTPNHHVVYLVRVLPGRVKGRKVKIGEVRRHVTDGSKARGTRYWRAFPEVLTEIPPLFDNRVLALWYLLEQWEAKQAVLAVMPSRTSRK